VMRPSVPTTGSFPRRALFPGAAAVRGARAATTPEDEASRRPSISRALIASCRLLPTTAPTSDPYRCEFTQKLAIPSGLRTTSEVKDVMFPLGEGVCSWLLHGTLIKDFPAFSCVIIRRYADVLSQN
jgi:hypothetical protein